MDTYHKKKPTLTRRRNILTAISRLTFVFARTMPKFPHEYTVRERAKRDADYVALYKAIMGDGEVMYYLPHRRPGRYLAPGDGHVYWSMSARRSLDVHGFHPLAISHHINRSTVEAQNAVRDQGLITAWDPTASAWGRARLLEEGDPKCRHQTSDSESTTRLQWVRFRYGQKILLKYYDCTKCGKRNIKHEIIETVK